MAQKLQMDKSEILYWLRETDGDRLNTLWRQADQTRAAHVGGQVHFRGLIEISNHCVRSCSYCGLRAPNSRLRRYRMSSDEVLACARQAMGFSYGTVVLQAGEDPGISKTWVADLIGAIKSLRPEPCGADTSSVLVPPAVTLSLGERLPEELADWKAAGADRYLLRFETSNRSLFDRIHPSLPGRRSDRIALLRQLRELGYEIGSGVMIGIPGQTYEDLADDILLFAELDLDMIGVGPFLPHPHTPLGNKQPDAEDTENAGKGETADDISIGDSSNHPSSIVHRQSPNTELMTYKVMALSRLACQRANIPSTTALATLNRANGRELGLQRGANVVMPNITPPPYRALYEIYPAKACVYETAASCNQCLSGRVRTIGRSIGAGRGDSANRLARRS
jgi:biotin synthase